MLCYVCTLFLATGIYMYFSCLIWEFSAFLECFLAVEDLAWSGPCISITVSFGEIWKEWNVVKWQGFSFEIPEKNAIFLVVTGWVPTIPTLSRSVTTIFRGWKSLVMVKINGNKRQHRLWSCRSFFIKKLLFNYSNLHTHYQRLSTSSSCVFLHVDVQMLPPNGWNN